jgi:hypothetical protein
VVEATAASAIALAVKRLNEVIESLPPFSTTRAALVNERNTLQDSSRRIDRIMAPDTAA